MQEAAMIVDDPGRLGDRLDHPGLIVWRA